MRRGARGPQVGRWGGYSNWPLGPSMRPLSRLGQTRDAKPCPHQQNGWHRSERFGRLPQCELLPPRYRLPVPYKPHPSTFVARIAPTHTLLNPKPKDQPQLYRREGVTRTCNRYSWLCVWFAVLIQVASPPPQNLDQIIGLEDDGANRIIVDQVLVIDIVSDAQRIMADLSVSWCDFSSRKSGSDGENQASVELKGSSPCSPQD